MKRFMGIFAFFLGCTMFGPTWAASPEGAASKPVAKAPLRTTGKQCVECHESEAKTHAYHGDCASCHTGAEAHSKAEKPKTVKIGKPASAQCLSCHETDKRRMHFSIAEHNKAGIQCSDCHGMHSPKVKSLNAAMEKGGKTVALCSSCHQDVMARFSMTSHHPVKEGGATCTGCHDPHASKQATLGGKTAQCTKCHQAVRGPHAFEHPPAAEDCTLRVGVGVSDVRMGSQNGAREGGRRNCEYTPFGRWDGASVYRHDPPRPRRRLCVCEARSNLSVAEASIRSAVEALCGQSRIARPRTSAGDHLGGERISPSHSRALVHSQTRAE